ncbi:MAG: M1 family aminopeptidase, partial [Angustibacter sp.]
MRSEHDGIELGIWCRRSWRSALDTDRILATTRAGFDYFHRLFDVRYPLDTYDQVFVPEFNFGAMENWGLVLFRDEGYLQRGQTTREDREQLATTQLHELAHMWFGNLVTMTWWDDLWLNESFAEYLAHRAASEATEHRAAWTTFLVHRKNWGYRADRRSTTHPVAGTAADTDAAVLNFDGISYAKGASALRQLAVWLGDDAFLAGLRAFISRNAYGNAELSDLIGIFTEVSGRDVRAWADSWLRTSGPSELRVTTQTEAGSYREVLIEQSSSPTRPHRFTLSVFDLIGTELAERASYPVELLAELTHCAVEPLRSAPAATVLLPNSGDETFALVELDPPSLTALMHHFSGLKDPLTRAVAWVTLIQL